MHFCLFLIDVAIILIFVNLMWQTHNIFCEMEEETRSVRVKGNPEETKNLQNTCKGTKAYVQNITSANTMLY